MLNRSSSLVSLLYFFYGLIGITVCWSMGALLLNEPFLPTPWVVFTSLPQLWNHYDVVHHSLVTVLRLMGSLILSTLLGAPCGYLCGRYPQINRWLAPYISFFYPLPKIVFLPIIIVLLGLGNLSKILLITLIIAFQIVVIVRDEAQKMPYQWVLTMRSISKNPYHWLKELYIPYLMPAVITSLRISLGTAIAVLFISETFVSIDGLGYMILDTMEARNYPEMYGSILLLSALGFILYGLLALWEEYCHYEQ